MITIQGRKRLSRCLPFCYAWPDSNLSSRCSFKIFNCFDLLSKSPQSKSQTLARLWLWSRVERDWFLGETLLGLIHHFLLWVTFGKISPKLSSRCFFKIFHWFALMSKKRPSKSQTLARLWLWSRVEKDWFLGETLLGLHFSFSFVGHFWQDISKTVFFKIFNRFALMSKKRPSKSQTLARLWLRSRVERDWVVTCHFSSISWDQILDCFSCISFTSGLIERFSCRGQLILDTKRVATVQWRSFFW